MNLMDVAIGVLTVIAGLYIAVVLLLLAGLLSSFGRRASQPLNEARSETILRAIATARLAARAARLAGKTKDEYGAVVRAASILCADAGFRVSDRVITVWLDAVLQMEKNEVESKEDVVRYTMTSNNFGNHLN